MSQLPTWRKWASDPSLFDVCYAAATERQQNKRVTAASRAWLKAWFMESKLGKEEVMDYIGSTWLG